MPLGIASLGAYLRRAREDVDVVLTDLSVGMRRLCFDDAPEASLAVPFLTGQVGNFFDESLYRAYQLEFLVYLERWRALENGLREALAGSFDSPEVARYDAWLERLLPLSGDEIVGLSAAFPEQILHAVLTAKRIKRRHPTMVVLLGGAALSSVDVDELLAAVPELDHAFRGEGETGLLAFLQGTHPSAIRGFSYRVNGSIHHNGTPVPIPMDSLPTPDLGALPATSYLNPTPVAPVAFSRGCRWRKCRFCSHNLSFSGYRTRAYDAFVESLSQHKDQLGISRFYFADQYIAAEDLFGISEAIIRHNLDIRFHVMGRPTRTYTGKVLETAAAAGCRWISWGVESFSSRLLEMCRKGTSPPEVVRVLLEAKRAGISNLAMMIFGLPGSDDDALQQTLDTAADVSDAVDAFTSSSFQLFEHTPFFHRAAAFGLVPESREILFTVSGRAVHSYRRAYSIARDTGERTLPRAAGEIAKWKKWQLFVRGGDSFFETLPAEHYLLHATRRLDEDPTRRTPTSPAKPRPYRRAG